MQKLLQRASRLSLNLLVLLLFVGCNSGPVRPVCQPVHGRLTFEKQPLAEAQLVFHPLNSSFVPLPTAMTRADGQFDVTTWADNDGAPLGEYLVTVEWKQLIQQGEEKVRSGKNMLPAIYADAKKSPLRCIIKEGDNTLPVFELKK